VCQGLYTYPAELQRVLFGATLIETASWLTGSTHEPHRPANETLFATLEGQRNGNSVYFTKIYDGKIKGNGAAIRYEGVISEDATEIEGRWIISSNWAGKFLMIRSGGKTQEVEYRAFERI
jgi:hypothetical protein